MLLAPSGCSLLTDFDSLTIEQVSSVGGESGASGSGGASPELGGAAGESGSAGGSGEAGTGAGGSGGSDSAVPENLFVNPDFEQGVSRWSAVGNCSLALVTEQPRSPSTCLCTANRTDTFEGPGYNLLGLLDNESEYSVQVWARATAGAFTLAVTHKHRCIDVTEPVYQRLGSVPVTTAWTPLAAIMVLPECELVESLLYVEGAPAGDDFCIDDVSLLPR